MPRIGRSSSRTAGSTLSKTAEVASHPIGRLICRGWRRGAAPRRRPPNARARDGVCCSRSSRGGRGETCGVWLCGVPRPARSRVLTRVGHGVGARCATAYFRTCKQSESSQFVAGDGPDCGLRSFCGHGRSDALQTSVFTRTRAMHEDELGFLDPTGMREPPTGPPRLRRPGIVTSNYK